MLRLLQGDVGSGKTIVALLAMAGVVEAGRQAALMAPTEILARQHSSACARWRESRFAASRSSPAATRRPSEPGSLAALAAGETDIAVGTHALFQESVVFARPRPCGGRRAAPLRRASAPRPRRQGRGRRSPGDDRDADPASLCAHLFRRHGRLRLREKPPGRPPIDTRALPIERLDDVVAAISRALRSGARAYWICPLVEESETLDVAAAEDRAANLRALFGDTVGPHARQDGRPGPGRRHGALSTRGDQGARRDHGGRGRRRRP